MAYTKSIRLKTFQQGNRMRVGIVNDTRSVAEFLKRIIQDSNLHLVAWTASSGQEAIDLCAKDRPDVVLMDLIMPGINGAEATREILKKAPVSILVVTSSVSLHFALACEALSHGAIDAIEPPTLDPATWKKSSAAFMAKVEKAARIGSRLESTRYQHLESLKNTVNVPVAVPPKKPLKKLIAAIGSSTGGPGALEQVLSKLPASFPATVLIAQHIGKSFMPDLVSWLKRTCLLPILIIREGDKPVPGQVMVCEGDSHLLMTAEGSFHYEPDITNYPYKPSIDLFFESLASNPYFHGTAAILTGIGKDGSEGIMKLQQKGWYTLAQTPDSCVARGMPQSAMEAGAVLASGSPSEIGDMIRNKIELYKGFPQK